MAGCSGRSSRSAPARMSRWPPRPANPARKRPPHWRKSWLAKSPGNSDGAGHPPLPAITDTRWVNTGDSALPRQGPMLARMESLAQLLALVLTAVALAPAAAHVLELPNKLPLPRDEYLTVQ